VTKLRTVIRPAIPGLSRLPKSPLSFPRFAFIAAKFFQVLEREPGVSEPIALLDDLRVQESAVLQVDVYQGAWGYALLSERKMGEMLEVIDLAKGGEHYKKGKTTGNHDVPVQTLSDIGITKNESSQAPFLAELPDETF